MIKIIGTSITFILLISVNDTVATLGDHNSNELIGNKTEPVRGNESPKLLSRRKRYIAFPEGSSFSVGIFPIVFKCLIFVLFCFV